jgi:hypothetical protein
MYLIASAGVPLFGSVICNLRLPLPGFAMEKLPSASVLVHCERTHTVKPDSPGSYSVRRSPFFISG